MGYITIFFGGFKSIVKVYCDYVLEVSFYLYEMAGTCQDTCMCFKPDFSSFSQLRMTEILLKVQHNVGIIFGEIMRKLL